MKTPIHIMNYEPNSVLSSVNADKCVSTLNIFFSMSLTY